MKTLNEKNKILINAVVSMGLFLSVNRSWAEENADANVQKQEKTETAATAVMVQTQGQSAIAALRLPKASQVHLEGMLGGRLRGNADYLLALLDSKSPLFHPNVAHGEMELLDCFRPDYVPPQLAPDKGVNRPRWARASETQNPQAYWMGDYAGKWLEAASLTAASLGHKELARRADGFAARLIAGQAPDGRICFSVNDNDLPVVSPKFAPLTTFLEWTSWMAVTGLLARYEETGEAQSLESARRVALWMMKRYERPESLVSGYAYGGFKVCGSDQMLRLYRHTQDKSFLEYMKRVTAAYAASAPTHQLGNKSAGLIHFYTQTACIESAVATDAAAGDETDLARMERIWEAFAYNYVSPFGAPGSPSTEAVHWDTRPRDYARHRLETCAIMQWISFSRQLYLATGKTRYIDAIEQAVYNALLGAQSVDGLKWQYISNQWSPKDPAIKFRKGWFNGPTSCCYYSGPRALSTLPWLIYAIDSNGICVNLFESSHADLEWQGQRLTIRQETSYPREGRINLSIQTKQPVACELKLRIPQWTTRAMARINDGKPLPGKPGQYLVLPRQWNNGDRIMLELELPVRIEKIWDAPEASASRHPFAVLIRGPQILTVDHANNPTLDKSASLRLPEQPDLAIPQASGNSYLVSGKILVDGKLTSVLFAPYADDGQKDWSQRVFGAQ